MQKKIGAKKLAKLQRKEEAKQYRQVWPWIEFRITINCRSQLTWLPLPLQAEEERRAQRKEREEQEEKERLKRKQDEQEQERLLKEEEQRRKKEREERELEEFKKWKDLIEVDGAGSVREDLEEKRAKLIHFADHVKREKVVLLEDLAITFGLQTQVFPQPAFHVLNLLEACL